MEDLIQISSTRLPSGKTRRLLSFKNVLLRSKFSGFFYLENVIIKLFLIFLNCLLSNFIISGRYVWKELIFLNVTHYCLVAVRSFFGRLSPKNENGSFLKTFCNLRFDSNPWNPGVTVKNWWQNFIFLRNSGHEPCTQLLVLMFWNVFLLFLKNRIWVPSFL